MSVIVSRALPDVRDGLKPVHRRVLYAMYDGGYRPDRGYFKCSRVVGDVMGTYHPHGDSSIYDAARTAGAAVVDALPAGRRPGQLRLPGQRPGRGDALHRVQAGADRHGDAPRHRQGDRRLPAQLRRPLPGADRPAGALPEPAGQRLGRHRGRHGHQHPAAQPARGRRRRPVVPGEPRGHRRGAARRADRAGQGPRLPDRRADRRPPGHRGRLPHRPRLDHHAGGRRGRGGAKGRQCLVVTELPYQVNPDNLAQKIAEPGQGRARSPASPTSATRPRRASASGWSSCSSATPSPRSC